MQAINLIVLIVVRDKGLDDFRQCEQQNKAYGKIDHAGQFHVHFLALHQSMKAIGQVRTRITAQPIRLKTVNMAVIIRLTICIISFLRSLKKRLGEFGNGKLKGFGVALSVPSILPDCPEFDIVFRSV